MTGYAGLVSLGHAAFFAIGAYTAAVLAEPNLAAYYKLDEASGLPQDSGPSGWHMAAMQTTNGGSITYGHPGPFAGSSSIRFTAVVPSSVAVKVNWS